MRVTYDKAVDAAYIYFTAIPDGGVARTFLVDEFVKTTDMINLDFDKANRLLGIEVLSASTQLPKELLDSAELI
jgi:uncharacterized protein YuzE